MNIHKVIKNYLSANGWPDKPIRVGPGSCGEHGCRKLHAYAETVETPALLEGGQSTWSFMFQRPCVMHDAGMKEWQTRQERKKRRSA